MDTISTEVLFAILGLLILMSAYFSSSETGMMAINRYRLRHLVKQNNKSAIRVEKLLQRPDKLIGLILIGNNLVNILASAIATIIGQRLFGDAGIAIATGALTLALLIFAEVTPKTLAALYPEKIAFPSSLLLRPLQKIFTPVVWFVNFLSNGLLKLLRIDSANGGDDHLSPDELRTIVHEAGAMIPKRHQEMLLSILDLEQVAVEDIMIPRSDIAGIDINDDWELILRQLTQSPHTRILLYRDNIDDAVGFIHAKDTLRMMLKEQLDKTTLLRSVKELYFIPEGTPLNTQLLKFQRRKQRIGLVIDEYGDIQGLVTLEDLLEEIVGDFTTSITPEVSEEIHQQEDGSFLVEGGISIRDINKEMNWQFPTDGPKTLNGLILEYLEDIPAPNISVRLFGYPIEVVEVENNMVKLVRIIPHLYQENE
ncbi:MULTISPECIES: CNNM domain-containing protein [unclassified Motilimonas]|uniref:HlyC/CorC family transporter n=1 Tax=Motilimonas TaxID=1914248 RepID=UPI001E3C43C8|nr:MULTISPECIES: CNNM domain-containing protein [unclassified Motilimonas]MCE0558599.1 CNNM domain-containing protein [Motilimonas sp. E26]MDO6527932.1 CNNM domain-containing protein [Motilimonas sp. 1_MG-2023]